MSQQNQLFDEPETEPPRNPSDTSRAAAESIQSEAPHLAERVFQFIKQQGERGSTDHEIQSALELDGSTERPRRLSLVKAGRIRKTDRTRPTPSGRDAHVYVAAEFDADTSPPAETPSAPKPAPNPPSRPAPDRKRQTDAATHREEKFGPILDEMTPEAVEAICIEIFPDWPTVFGALAYTPQTARRDRVARKLLLTAIEDSQREGGR